MADNPNPFIGIPGDHPVHAVIERLMSDIYSAVEWSDDHEALLDQWRAARGEAAMDGWSWWLGETCERYDHDFTTRDAAISVGRKRFAAEGRFEIIEVRMWCDTVKDGEDVSEFAAQRNHEVVEVTANG